MSLIAAARRLLQRIRRPSYFVGTDLEGNKFYEHPASSNDSRRKRRTVEYYDPEDMWKYIGGGKQLSAQWHSWLTHTRPHPPTIKELQADVLRRQRVLMNASLIAAREKQAPAIAAGSQAITTHHQSHDATALQPAGLHAIPQNKTSHPMPPQDASPKPPKSELPEMASKPAYEPQSWKPQALRRGE
ncbi:hypothetical protein PLICRDRAFT_30206 [Plicaturopsis crispa FD-325 SS-3]|nr:hypothetical protein PLICRDRAFT_30206 [Plicaturopsis crispa FD-325 SS-3]